MTIHTGTTLATRDNLTVIDCHVCGYAHLDKFPADSDLASFYESSFWQKEKAGALADFERAREWWAALHGDWLSIVEAHTNGRTLLDVGCGYGLFLREAASRGWDADGIDPSRESVEYVFKDSIGKNIRVVHTSWSEFNPVVAVQEGIHPLYSYRMVIRKYSCISAHWLIEHLPNPLEFLNWCKAHLAPGGVLLLALPQEWTEDQFTANEKAAVKNWWLHHTHLNYFSQTSIANLLGRAGFRIVDSLATFPMETFIKFKHWDYTNDPDLGRHAHMAVESDDLKLTREERIRQYRERAHFVQGRDLILVCKYD